MPGVAGHWRWQALTASDPHPQMKKTATLKKLMNAFVSGPEGPGRNTAGNGLI